MWRISNAETFSQENIMTTRRSFISKSLLVGALGATGNTFASPATANKFSEEWDLVIIGAGGAGLSAAAHAREKGLKGLVLEKTGVPGGSSAISGG